LATTAADGTTAPEASVTRPEMDACAKRCVEPIDARKATPIDTTTQFLRLITESPCD
jgi:hypothetical protein